jgi:hypothetical protein
VSRNARCPRILVVETAGCELQQLPAFVFGESCGDERDAIEFPVSAVADEVERAKLDAAGAKPLHPPERGQLGVLRRLCAAVEFRGGRIALSGGCLDNLKQLLDFVVRRLVRQRFEHPLCFGRTLSERLVAQRAERLLSTTGQGHGRYLLGDLEFGRTLRTHQLLGRSRNRPGLRVTIASNRPHGDRTLNGGLRSPWMNPRVIQRPTSFSTQASRPMSLRACLSAAGSTYTRGQPDRALIGASSCGAHKGPRAARSAAAMLSGV